MPNWKVQVCNIIFYSLDCIQLTTADISRLNAIQYESLRNNLGIPPTFIDREQTNARMYASILQEQLNDMEENQMPPIWSHCEGAWRPSSDPMVQVVLEFDGVTVKTPFFRRPGRLRADWVVETCKDSCSLLFGPHTVFAISD